MARKVLPSIVLCGLVILAGCATQKTAEKKGPIRQYVETDTGRWLIHDVNRPRPPVVRPGKVPSDAVLLFGGSNPNLSGWTDMKGGDSKWIVRDDYMESVKGAGYIRTKREFGSCQLHVEFRTPVPVKGSGQGRGNSGVFLMGEYEVQSRWSMCATSPVSGKHMILSSFVQSSKARRWSERRTSSSFKTVSSSTVMST